MALTIDSSNKITGLASGIETDTVIEGLMATYKLRISQKTQKTTKLEWKAEAYRDINTQVKNFRSKYLSVLSKTNMMSESSYSAYQVTMQNTTSAVSVSASASAEAGTMVINSITQLATAAKASSTNAFTGTSYTSDTKLADLSLANAFTFDVNDELSFSINGETFTFTKDTTIGEMMKAVNASDAGVKMKYSSLTKGFSITSGTMGSASEIEIANISGNAFAASNSALGISEGTYSGQDAVCSINGITVTQASNTFTYDGITYSLNDTSSSPIQFTLTQDYQSTVDSIVSFVDAYNTLVEELQDTVQEKVNHDYDPLTDEQKEEMSEEEIEKWEKEAKSGMLYNDPYISSLLTSLRSAFYSEVEGAGMNLADIGLTTGLYSDGAKITVNEDKLLAALKEDPATVKSMFVQTASDSAFSKEGLMVRISEALLSYTKDTTDVALDNLDEQISEAKEKIEEMEDRADEKEEALWAKFSTMETALSKLNSMSSWLSTLFTSA